MSEAQEKLAALSSQLRQGAITREQFAAGANRLQVRDPAGTWWQPDPGGNGWLFYDGGTWKPGTPLDQGATPPPRPPDTGSAPQSVEEFKAGLMDFKTFQQVRKDVPIAERPQKWWDLFSILGGIVGAVLWALYSIEDIDLITPLIIIALPILLIMFRKQIDGLLQPLQTARSKIPVMVLVGASIALPFLTAVILYNFFGVTEYSLIRANMIVGVLAGYALIRNPVSAQGLKPFQGKGLPSLAVFIVFFSLIVCPVMAHDCASDPFRAEDCLRSPGFAEGLAGLATVAVVVLVNGAEVVRTIYKTPKQSEDQEDKVFTVVVSTRDAGGATSTTLDMVNAPSIFFYAHCEEVGKGRFPSGDETIRFALQSAHQFLSLTDLGMKGGERCAQVSFRDPQPEGDLPDTADVMVSAGIGPNTIPVTVTLSLKSGKYILEAY